MAPLVGPGSCYFLCIGSSEKHRQLLERKVTSIEFSIALTQAAGDVREGLGSWGHGGGGTRNPMDGASAKLVRVDEGQLRAFYASNE